MRIIQQNTRLYVLRRAIRKIRDYIFKNFKSKRSRIERHEKQEKLDLTGEKV